MANIENNGTVVALLNEINSNLSQTISSRKDELRVMQAMLSDPTYEVTVYNRDGVDYVYNPALDFRAMCASVISNAAKVPAAEAAQLMEDYAVRKGEASNIVEMTTIDGIQVNVLPYCANGLTITDFSYTRSNDKVELTVRNDTGYAIKSTSDIAYKCYDSDGIVLKTGNVYLEDLNNGEGCNVYFYAEDDTVNIVFGEGSVRKQ